MVTLGIPLWRWGTYSLLDAFFSFWFVAGETCDGYWNSQKGLSSPLWNALNGFGVWYRWEGTSNMLSRNLKHMFQFPFQLVCTKKTSDRHHFLALRWAVHSTRSTCCWGNPKICKLLPFLGGLHHNVLHGKICW